MSASTIAEREIVNTWPDYHYENVLAASEQVNWRVEDLIGPGKRLDFRRPFMPESLPRIARLRELLPDEVFIQVDGGVGKDNVRDLHEAGASLLVAGSSIFGQDDIAAAYAHLAGL